jgi:hypothetical protein
LRIALGQGELEREELMPDRARIDVAHALATHPLAVPRLCPWLHLPPHKHACTYREGKGPATNRGRKGAYHQISDAVEGRDLDRAAQHGLPQRQRYVHIQIRALAPEDVARQHLDRQPRSPINAGTCGMPRLAQAQGRKTPIPHLAQRKRGSERHEKEVVCVLVYVCKSDTHTHMLCHACGGAR